MADMTAKRAAAIIWDDWFFGAGQPGRNDVEDLISQVAQAAAARARANERVALMQEWLRICDWMHAFGEAHKSLGDQLEQKLEERRKFAEEDALRARSNSD